MRPDAWRSGTRELGSGSAELLEQIAQRREARSLIGKKRRRRARHEVAQERADVDDVRDGNLPSRRSREQHPPLPGHPFPARNTGTFPAEIDGRLREVPLARRTTSASPVGERDTDVYRLARGGFIEKSRDPPVAGARAPRSPHECSKPLVRRGLTDAAHFGRMLLLDFRGSTAGASCRRSCASHCPSRRSHAAGRFRHARNPAPSWKPVCERALREQRRRCWRRQPPASATSASVHATMKRPGVRVCQRRPRAGPHAAAVPHAMRRDDRDKGQPRHRAAVGGAYRRSLSEQH